MSSLCRIGVAVDSDLLQSFDRYIQEQGYVNRSEAFRDLIRDKLVRHRVDTSPEEPVVGTVTLVYDHHVRLLPEKLAELQHDHHHEIVSNLHVHLDHDNCLEVIVVRGSSNQVHKLGELLISTKGVKHGKLVVTSAQIAGKPHKSHSA